MSELGLLNLGRHKLTQHGWLHSCQMHYVLSISIAVMQVVNVGVTLDDSGLLVTWDQQPGNGYNYEVCYTDLSTTTQSCGNVTDAGSHTFISATGSAIYQVTVRAFDGQRSAPSSTPILTSKLLVSALEPAR